MNDEEQNKILSAYEKKALHSTFYDLVIFLEIYIEKAGYYPDWLKRGQIKDKWKGWGGNWKDENTEKVKSYMMTELFGLKVMLKINSKKEGLFETREELKQEFYRWIDAVRINAENYPQTLKNILFNFHEVLEGRGDEFSKRLVEKSEKELAKWSDEKLKKEMNRGFDAIYKNYRKEEKKEQSLIGKRWNEITLESRFNGNVKQGKKTFVEIIKKENGEKEVEKESEKFGELKSRSIQPTKINYWWITIPILLVSILFLWILRKRNKTRN